MEKPVVATGVGGVREIVGECGVLAPAMNPVALAQAMQDVMHSPEREQLGRALEGASVENFSMKANADEWEKVYVSALAPPV